MKQKKYSSCPLVSYSTGVVMIHVRKLSLDAASKMIPLLISSFLVECSITELCGINGVTPSISELKDIIIDKAIDTIYSLQKSCTTKYPHWCVIKTKEQINVMEHHVVKLLVQFDKALDKVTVVNMGIEGAANTSIRWAKVVNFILKLYDTP